MNNISPLNLADDFISSLDQVDALITVAMHANITECHPTTAFNYFLVMSNLVSNLKLKCAEM